MESLTVEPVTYKAIIINDTVASSFTIFLDGLNGPVISASTEGEAKAKFSEALKLACAVRNLSVFASAIKTHDEEQRKRVTNKSAKVEALQIEYTEVETASC